MKTLKGILLLGLFLCAAPLAAAGPAGSDVGGAVTGTARVAGLDVPLDQVLVTPKPDHAHIIWDAFAERDAIRRAGKSFSLARAALDLAKGPGRAAAPKTSVFKVDIAEFPERDDYGAPRWDRMDFLGRYEVVRARGKWSVRAQAAR